MIRDDTLPALPFPFRISRHDLDTLFERCRIKPGELLHVSQHARPSSAR
jgi:hypothetical protein